MHSSVLSPPPEPLCERSSPRQRPLADGLAHSPRSPLVIAGSAILWLLVMGEVLQGGRVLLAEHALSKAAHSAVSNVQLSAATPLEVRRLVQQDLDGTLAARRLETIEIRVDGRPIGPYEVCSPKRGDQIRVQLSARPPDSWSLLQRLGIFPAERSLVTECVNYAP